MNRRLLLLLVLLPVFFSCSPFKKESSTLYINGRIEGDEHDVGTKYAGRVVRIFHDEGDNVKRGEFLAVLDSEELNERLKGAEENYRALLSTVKAKEEELNYYRNKLSAEEKRLSELSKTVELQIKQSEDNVKSALSKLKMAEANYRKALSAFKKTKKDYVRYRNLYRRRVISESSFDSVKLSFETAKANLEAAKSAVSAAQSQLNSARRMVEIAKEKRKEVGALSDEIRALKRTILAKENEVEAYRKKAEAAKRAADEIRATISNLSIRSPIDGTITEKLVELGEVVTPGQKLFTLYNLDNLYFEGYVPERKVGLIHLGQKGFVKVDSYPNRKFPVVVTFVSSEAEFTPKEVQTKEERVKEVFKVKLKLLENPDHILKPGMPADCYVEIEKR
jgi:HlyD family secretion protein